MSTHRDYFKAFLGLGLVLGFLSIGIGSYIISAVMPQSSVKVEVDNNWVSLDGNTIQWNEKNQWKIIYIGFIGCSSRCPISLNKMNNLGSLVPKSQYRFLFFNTDPLVKKKDLQEFMKSFPYVQAYISTHENPHNQLRKLKFSAGIQNPEEHSDHYLVFPPGNEFPFISQDLHFLEKERSPPIKNSSL